MIRCHLARMMGEHKMRIADVARETGLSRATLTLLYKETAQKVDLDAIEPTFRTRFMNKSAGIEGRERR